MMMSLSRYTILGSHACWAALGSPRALEAWGACLWPGPWLALKDGRGPRFGFRLPSIEHLRLGRAPEPQAEAEGMLRINPILSWKVLARAPKGCSPEPPGGPGGVGQGSLGWEPLIPRINIALC
jgi:hypothetical protein